MQKEMSRREGCLRFFLWLIITAAFVCIVVALSGCSAQKQVVKVPEIREIRTTDTLTLRDSVYVSKVIHQKGDTVFIHDTLRVFGVREKINRVEVRDSIPYPVEVTKEVRVRNWYDKATARGFWALLVVFVAIVGWKVFKRYYLHIR